VFCSFLHISQQQHLKQKETRVFALILLKKRSQSLIWTPNQWCTSTGLVSCIWADLLGSKSSSMWRDSPKNPHSHPHGGSHRLSAVMPTSRQINTGLFSCHQLSQHICHVVMGCTFSSCICLEFNTSQIPSPCLPLALGE
jgi:hypothetical protein